MNQILKRQTSRSHYGSKVPAVTITLFKTFIYDWKLSQIWFKVVPYTSGKIWSARLMFLFFLAVCLNISTLINVKILANSNQQTQSYQFTSHIAAFLSVVFITEMLEICTQTSYDENVQLILKSYLTVVYGTPLINNHEKFTGFLSIYVKHMKTIIC